MSQWAGVLVSGATTNAITGLSTDASKNMPSGRLTIPIYAAQFLGGMSGTMAVEIFGSVGGVTLQIAGRTAMTAGNFQLWNSLSGSSAYEYGVRPGVVSVKGTSAGALSYSVVVTASLFSF